MIGFYQRLVMLTTVVFVASMNAQTPPWAPEFRYGASYTFEQISATRQVNDKFDHGRINLVANVYRPVKNDRRQVVLYSHESTGGWVRSPKETSGAPPRSFLEFFISRGFTIVAPMRRGVGFSSGTYLEECPLSAGQCTVAENTASSISGLQEAIRDTDAVIDQIILGKLVSRDAKILLAGVSRGGFLSLVMAGRRPELAMGVLNFVGGWLGISDGFSQSEIAGRMQFQREQLTVAGKKSQVRSLWIYAARDAFYSETVTRQFFQAFMDAGGHGEYIFVKDHSLQNGHLIATLLPHWSAPVSQLLTDLGH